MPDFTKERSVQSSETKRASILAERNVLCPLCHGNNLKKIQIISATDVVGIYGSDMGEVVRGELRNVERVNFLLCRTCDLRFFSPSCSGSEALYEQLQKFHLYYQQEKPEFDFSRTKIGAFDKVLEVGCGAGAFGNSIRCGSFVGLEVTSTSAAKARALGLSICEETVEQHCEHNFEAYDVVCAFQVLEHVAEPHLFISSALKALRPGGKLILSIPSADSFAGDLPNHALDLPPHHVSRWSDRCLTGLGSIFPVSVDQVWHEPLRPIHFRMFVQSRFYRAYCALTGRNLVPVDTSSVSRLGLWLGWKLSKAFAFGPDLSKQRGISVTVVLRKLA